MTDFIVLALLARTRMATQNLFPSWVPYLRWSPGCIRFPDHAEFEQIEKIAYRAALPQIDFRFSTRNHQYSLRNDQWEHFSFSAHDELPRYTSSAEYQFERFLLAPLDTTPIPVNPDLSNVRKYCIRNPIPTFLFRGSLSEVNQLGAGPGIPYWVEIPHGGTFNVITPEPDRVQRSPLWRRMGLTWLGRPSFKVP